MHLSPFILHLHFLEEEIMSITTGTGDDGLSGLLGGQRLPKNHPRFEAYGTVDEAQSAMGIVLALENIPPDIKSMLSRIMSELFTVGSSLASVDPEIKVPQVTSTMIVGLETDIKTLEKSLPHLKHFIIPSGTLAASTCFWIRAIIRRAERHVAALMGTGTENETVLVYLNRLGDLMFLIARALNKEAGVTETEWQGS
jgi:cob(I)alamin adenosyltransferase